MTIENITSHVKRIKRKYGEDDPFRLCRDMGIIQQYSPMGTNDRACKGFFYIESRIKVIVLNSDLSKEFLRIILTHELGHSTMHSSVAAVRAFHDFQLFDETSTYEYEANIFAAEFLMDDNDVLELLNDDMSFFGAARALRVPAELLDFKFRVLKRRGYAVNPPMLSDGSFLKRVENPYAH